MQRSIKIILCSVAFLGMFFYFYRKSGKFRKSISAAFVSAFVLTSVPLESKAKEADAFSPKPPQHQSSRRALSSSRTRANNPGKPNNGDSGDDDNGMPQFPQTESVEKTKERVENIDEYIRRIEESSDSESEEGSCEAEKKGFRVEIANNKLVLRLTRGNNSASVGEQELRKKIYHAPDFNVKLPKNLDLNYVKSLRTKERLEYLSKPGVLPVEFVKEYMTQVGRHFLDPNTEIKTGTLGKNKVGREGWSDPIAGIHAYNPVTGNNIFFSDQGSDDPMFHTAMRLNGGQIKDLETNDNIM